MHCTDARKHYFSRSNYYTVRVTEQAFDLIGDETKILIPIANH